MPRTDDPDCDDDDPTIGEAQPYYVDEDDDLYGDQYGTPTLACPDEAQRKRWQLDHSDCDDELPEVNPGRTEVVGNGIDDDCSGGDAESWAAGGCSSCSASPEGARPAWLGILSRRR